MLEGDGAREGEETGVGVLEREAEGTDEEGDGKGDPYPVEEGESVAEEEKEAVGVFVQTGVGGEEGVHEAVRAPEAEGAGGVGKAETP